MFRRLFPALMVIGLGTGGCGGPTSSDQTVMTRKATAAVGDALASSPTVRVIVTLKEPEDLAVAASVRADQVAVVQRGVLDGISTKEFRLLRQFEFTPALTGEVTQDGLARLEALPSVLHVGLDHKVGAFLSETTALIGARDIQSAGFRGSATFVAVLDTGIDRNHPDLKSRVSTTEGCTQSCPNGTDSQTGAGSAPDNHGHGTHVAGIIASQGVVAPVGVAPSTTIVPVKVLGPDGGSDSAIIAGLEFVFKYKIQVVNMSLGGGRYEGYCDAEQPAFASIVKSLWIRGTVVVVASGNEGYGTAISSPGCLSNAVSVGAVYAGASDESEPGCAGPAADRVACFSNSYSLLDLLAPGVTVTSSVPGGGTATKSGTSQATPHVAGAAAIIMGARPAFTSNEVYDLLRSTGRRVTDTNGVTTPRIDLRAVLQALR